MLSGFKQHIYGPKCIEEKTVASGLIVLERCSMYVLSLVSFIPVPLTYMLFLRRIIIPTDFPVPCVSRA